MGTHPEEREVNLLLLNHPHEVLPHTHLYLHEETYLVDISQTTKRLQSHTVPIHSHIITDDLTKTNPQRPCHRPSVLHRTQLPRCLPTCSAPQPLVNYPPRSPRPFAFPWANTIPRTINRQPQPKSPPPPQTLELHFLPPTYLFQLRRASEDRRNVPVMSESRRISNASCNNTRER